MTTATRTTETPRALRLKPEAAAILGISVRQLERRLAENQYPTTTDSAGRVLIDIGNEAATAEAELVANYRTGSEVFAASTDGLQVLAKRLLDDRQAERTGHAETVQRLERRLETETRRARRLGILAACLAIVTSSVVSWQWQESKGRTQEPIEPRRQSAIVSGPQTTADAKNGTTAQQLNESGSDTTRSQSVAVSDGTAPPPVASHDAETVAAKAGESQTAEP